MKKSDILQILAFPLAVILPYIGYRISLIEHDFTYIVVGGCLAMLYAMEVMDE